MTRQEAAQAARRIIGRVGSPTAASGYTERLVEALTRYPLSTLNRCFNEIVSYGQWPTIPTLHRILGAGPQEPDPLSPEKCVVLCDMLGGRLEEYRGHFLVKPGSESHLREYIAARNPEWPKPRNLDQAMGWSE